MLFLLQIALAHVLTLTYLKNHSAYVPRLNCVWLGRGEKLLSPPCTLSSPLWVKTGRSFNRLFVPYRSPTYCDMIPWCQIVLISSFMGLKLVSVVLGIFKAQASFTMSYRQKGEPMSSTIVFLPHCPASRSLCCGLTEAQAFKSSCKNPIPQGLPVWLQLIMSLVINTRDAFLLVCKNGYSQGIF